MSLSKPSWWLVTKMTQSSFTICWDLNVFTTETTLGSRRLEGEEEEKKVKNL